MLKELKYLLFITIIFLFIFLTTKYYFSDNNKKNSFRALNQVEKKIEDFSLNLILLKSNTEHIVEYVKKDTDKNKKNYNFWKLINNHE